MAIRRLIVANRGEIAARIFRTCERLEIESVAVVAPDDRGAYHTRVAGRTVEIGSYLDPTEHVRAALETGADAVHPGYGFLAENGDFAEAVIAAGLMWVGPSPEALRLGGDKLAAKRVAKEAGVRTVPQGSAAEIGYPLVVKAAAGGGGRGMRVVRSASELDDALAAAGREAEAAFGDGTVFCERYLERPRHVEAQLLGHRGGVAVLGARDCSIQRRHQKLVEESPAVGLDPSAWPRIAAGAVAFAEAIGYEGAGTAEFLVDGPDVYFLELNGRIQVEHPVTEEVTGLDIVELQLRVAAGEPVELQLASRGHAIEARLYAEDPRSFLPQAGTIGRLVLPAGVRIDAGVEEGDEIGLSYDPLIAKLIAHGADRGDAIAKLELALDADRGRRRHDQPAVPPLARAAPRVQGRLRLDGVPARARAALGAATTRGSSRLCAGVAAERAGSSPTSSSGRGSGRARSGFARTGDDHRPDAGDRPRRRGRRRRRGHRARPLVVLEAMKMEMPVLAPFAATVAAVHVAPGDQVASGAVLVELG